MIKTTKKQFKQFKDHCLRWIELFGITTWDITIYKEELHDRYIAETRLSYNSKSASIVLNTKINKNTDLDQTALHEVLHCALGDITTVAERRYVTETEITNAVESAVNTLVNTLYGKL